MLRPERLLSRVRLVLLPDISEARSGFCAEELPRCTPRSCFYCLVRKELLPRCFGAGVECRLGKRLGEEHEQGLKTKPSFSYPPAEPLFLCGSIIP